MKKIVFSLAILFLSSTAFAMKLPGPLVDTQWLANNKDKVVILDVRKDIKSFTKKPVFKTSKKSGKRKLVKVAGHIPGAILVNYKKLRSTRTINGRKVQKMIVSKSDFEKLMQSSGVNKDSAIVIVSKGQGNGDVTMATRFYWQMKYYGHDNMAILNGGMAQWINDGRSVSTTVSKPGKGNWVATAERKEILATSEDVAKAGKKGIQLVDTRPISLYLGTWYKKSYVYDNGHIPGAKPYPNELLTTKMPAKFIATDKARKLLVELGVKPNKQVITYCNSGHLASGSWFVMSELLGNRNVKLYDGSMHEWTLEKRPTVKFEME